MRTALTFAIGLMLNQLVLADSVSTQAPYLLSVTQGVELRAIITAGDSVPGPDGKTGYRMTGAPDGLGAYDNGDGTFTVLMNHEISAKRGVERAHGGKGAFVSQWRVRKSDLRVLSGNDLAETVFLWNSRKKAHVSESGVSFSRLCSADLARPSAWLNSKSGLGWEGGQLYLTGEEDKGGRAFAFAVGRSHNGQAYELPLMGSFPHENLLASPYMQDRTIVIATEDGGENMVHVYAGEKQPTGNPVEQAGLMNGKLRQILIEDYLDDDPDVGFRSGRFRLVEEGGTSLSKLEDGAWDSIKPTRFYFVTSSSFDGNSRLWRIEFDDIRKPELGGKITVLVDGEKAGVKMMDNITVDEGGDVYIQEDTGNNPHLGGVWRFHADDEHLEKLAVFDAERFIKGNPGFLTENEESSGIIEVTSLFLGVAGYDTKQNRYFLLSAQAHHTMPGEIVSGGQLLLMKALR